MPWVQGDWKKLYLKVKSLFKMLCTFRLCILDFRVENPGGK